ncbi:MAG: heat-inducible transcription repressor HrcA [Ruminococcaceae bacterium]|nr:heat-inducible transcription repressor HrcA [Oscillospiraceae bacterium]
MKHWFKCSICQNAEEEDTMANENPVLSERKKQILKAIVEAHIEGGEPVGSKYILQNTLMSCSSATIRNEMAELEQMGYLVQPHTSAGRVPSEAGYRFYVDALVEQYARTTHDVVKINQLLKAKMTEIDQILDTASRLASTMTNYTGIAIKPKASSVTMSRFEIISIDRKQFAMVMITSGGTVKTKKVHTDMPIPDDALPKLSELINVLLCGIGADMITLPIIMEMENEMGDAAFLVNPAVKCVYEVMSEIDGGQLKFSGLNHLLKYPEYSDTQQLGQLLGTLEDQDEILDLVSSAESDEINVLIGSESPVKVMNNSALVFKPIKKNGRTVGVIGVLGPRRMNYRQVLKTIDEIGGSISVMFDEEKQLSDGSNRKADDDGRQ